MKEFESQLAEKDCEILALVNRIADKEAEINQLQSDILSLKHHQSTPVTK